RALGELGEVAAVDHGLTLGADLQALGRAIVAQVPRLLEEADVLGERDRHGAFAHPPDVVVAVLATVARLRHDVGEYEAGLLAEDFLGDLRAAFHPTNCRHPGQRGSIRRDALYAQPFDERPVRRQDVPLPQVARRNPREVGDLHGARRAAGR